MGKVNSDYEILTPSGWSDFDGITKSKKETLVVIFTDNTNLICTPDHRIRINSYTFVEAKTLKPQQKFYNKTVVSITLHKKLYVYDPINVKLDNEYYSNGIISHNCHWLGSSSTLIRGDIISKLSVIPYEYSKDNLDITTAPIPNHNYVLVADTSRGVGGDYSAFTVIDVTEIPYRMVAKFRDNKISPLLYPSVIYRIANDYNKALVLVEINDIGGQVADILYQDMEYENILFISKEKGGQKLSTGFSNNVQAGVRTDKLVKRIGCSTLKSLIEENKFIVTDPDAISEFSTFTENKGHFSADIGYHDDIVITLVLFSWMTTQTYFKDLTNGDLRKSLYENQINNIEQNLTPFGIICDGIHEEPKMEKILGEYWSVVDAPDRPDNFGVFDHDHQDWNW
jgi:hypothetical protein